MIGEEILYLPISELSKRIESKKISPVDLTKAYLDRSEKLGPRLGAYAKLTPEIALEQAETADKEIKRGHYRGPLHGIPYAAKDLLAVKGVPCTWGAKPYANQVFDYDERASYWQGIVSSTDQVHFFLQIPIVQNHSHRNHIRLRQRISKEIQRLRSDST